MLKAPILTNAPFKYTYTKENGLLLQSPSSGGGSRSPFRRRNPSSELVANLFFRIFSTVIFPWRTYTAFIRTFTFYTTPASILGRGAKLEARAYNNGDLRGGYGMTAGTRTYSKGICVSLPCFFFIPRESYYELRKGSTQSL